eukprot:scaffold39887_cov229-Amphora_coffeaeformis.AAC.1
MATAFLPYPRHGTLGCASCYIPTFRAVAATIRVFVGVYLLGICWAVPEDRQIDREMTPIHRSCDVVDAMSPLKFRQLVGQLHPILLDVLFPHPDSASMGLQRS